MRKPHHFAVIHACALRPGLRGSGHQRAPSTLVRRLPSPPPPFSYVQETEGGIKEVMDRMLHFKLSRNYLMGPVGPLAAVINAAANDNAGLPFVPKGNTKATAKLVRAHQRGRCFHACLLRFPELPKRKAKLASDCCHPLACSLWHNQRVIVQNVPGIRDDFSQKMAQDLSIIMRATG